MWGVITAAVVAAIKTVWLYKIKWQNVQQSTDNKVSDNFRKKRNIFANWESFTSERKGKKKKSKWPRVMIGECKPINKQLLQQRFEALKSDKSVIARGRRTTQDGWLNQTQLDLRGIYLTFRCKTTQLNVIQIKETFNWFVRKSPRLLSLEAPNQAQFIRKTKRNSSRVHEFHNIEQFTSLFLVRKTQVPTDSRDFLDFLSVNPVLA